MQDFYINNRRHYHTEKLKQKKGTTRGNTYWKPIRLKTNTKQIITSRPGGKVTMKTIKSPWLYRPQHWTYIHGRQSPLLRFVTIPTNGKHGVATQPQLKCTGMWDTYEFKQSCPRKAERLTQRNVLRRYCVQKGTCLHSAVHTASKRQAAYGLTTLPFTAGRCMLPTSELHCNTTNLLSRG